MKKIRFTLIVLACSLVTQNSYATCDGSACTGVVIENIRVDAGLTYIKTDGIESDLDNCTPTSGVNVALNHTHSSADKIYALLLTAFTSNKKVTLIFNETPGTRCEIKYISVPKE